MWCSELYEPGNRLRGQAASLPVVHGQPPPNVEMSAQQRKDSWRGRPASANLPQGQVLPDTEGSAPQRKDSWRGRSAAQPPGFEGPIRSRLVENGYLGEVEPAKGMRQGSGTKAWPQPDEAEASAHSGLAASANRPMARKDPEQPERWNSAQPPGSTTWRGPPGAHGRGQGPEGRERQWGGRGPHPPHPPPHAGPIQIPNNEQLSTAAEGEVPQARSLDKDWRASKSKPGSAPGPSSKEWANYRNQAHEGHVRTPAAPEQTDRQPHARQRHARNNPEWMADGAAAGSEDASGLSAAARKAKDFEAERQRMKEEWKQEQTQLRGAAHQPVSMADFMTDEDLEALKTDAHPHRTDAGHSTGVQEVALDMTATSGPDTTNSLGHTLPPGFAGPAPLSTGFDFTTLAQAAGHGLPQMPPMPKGVATLEDLERSVRAPPGFGGQANLLPTASQTFAGANHSAVLPPASAAQPPPVLWAAPDAGAPENAAARDSGKALLTLLSKAAPSTAPMQQQPGSTAITSPPGFPAPTKPPQAPISWGSSSQLQGIWGAPALSSNGSQALWGAPVPEARSSPAQTQLPQAYSPHSFTTGQEAGGAQPQGSFSPLMQTAASTPGSLPEQPNSTMQVHFGTAGQLNPLHRAGSGPMQSESDSVRGSMASNAANPLLALLGQHRSSMNQGSRGEQDPQLQAFLQAQSGAYSWHPPQAAPKPQMQHTLLPQQQHQRQQQHLTGHLTNAAISQDLLRQLQLGQSHMQAAAPQAYPQLAQSALHTYQQAAPAYAQPQSGGIHAHDQPHLQYWQQHQLPVNLGRVRPGTAYGQIQSQGSGPQHALHSQVPGESFPYSLSSQGNTHLGMDRQQFSSRPAPASQAYGNNVLASQTLLQQLQQQSYSQPPQRGAGLDRFFNPAGFSRSQHAPPVPASKPCRT
ncbi:hypothetical protein ABBQ32_004044 [Trebouxia sp. C0010 RCD-2024]